MGFQCQLCKRSFETVKGRNIHYNSCKRKENYFVRRTNGIINEADLDVETVPDKIILQAEDIPIKLNESLYPNLPPYNCDLPYPLQNWNEYTGKEFCDEINGIYEEVIHWRKNLFKVPSGSAGRRFITELTEWLDHFNKGTEFSSIALKVFMVLPCLLLQKPSRNSKAKDHTKKLEYKLNLWQEGNISEIIKDNRTIQRKLPNIANRTSEDSARSFAKLIWNGKVHAALKMLTKDYENGVLKVDDVIYNELQKKHPKPAGIKEESLLHGPIDKVLPSYFDNIDESLIASATRKTKGSGGPSQLDSDQYHHILLSKKFKKEGKELREQIANLTRKIASEIVDPSSIEALTACRLIALNKNPGVRPIGIGETLRRIMGKSISWTLKDEIQEAAGPLQMATGLKNGAEAAIHSMREIFACENTDAVILVDAENAFNSLNRETALHNIQITCPHMSTVVINTYRKASRMVLFGAKDIMSVEGTTQGDNLSMSLYALGLTPMIRDLGSMTPNVKQVWLADDATGAGNLADLKKWWLALTELGNKYGYYVNASKSWIIVKNEETLNRAKILFEDTEIKYTTEGKRHLGAALGSENFKQQYVSDKVKDWCEELDKLSEFALSQPQAVYAAFIHGEQHKFSYFLRTIPEMENFMIDVDSKIENTLLPAILDEKISPTERELYSLPTRLGGLGIPFYAQKAKVDFDSSSKISRPLTVTIINQSENIPSAADTNKIRLEISKENDERANAAATVIEQKLPASTKRAVEQAKLKGASSWLNILPIEDHGFSLNKGEFRDGIAFRYNKPLRGLPSHCPCGQKFDTNHALNCKRGGFITMRHNQIRDYEAELLKMTHNDVETEPELQSITNEHITGLDNDLARPDIRAKGVWREHQNAYFDVRVTNVNSDSQRNMPIVKILSKHEKEKKRMYNNRIMNVEHGTFTPLVFSVTGGEGPETSAFHKHLASKISQKTEDRYERVLTLIRCKLSFLILRAVLTCLRGSRSYSKSNALVGEFGLAWHTARL